LENPGVVSGNDTVDSLNVSVAAGIVLHAMLTSARASE
jgi:tRNA G18 (ribose-2'-O)-methylase SpoU